MNDDLTIARLREKLSSVECSYSDMLEMWKSCEKQNQTLRALLIRARVGLINANDAVPCGNAEYLLNEIDDALTKF